MACPAGYTAADLERLGRNDKLIITPVEFEEVVKEPYLLKTVLKEPAYYFAGQYAILMQFAHPGLAKGSIEHSNFANRILNRLITTSRYMGVCVFGTEEEKAAITSLIHSYHSRVKGEGYYADDPELHKWTAATLFVAFVKVHEWVFGEMSRENMERLFLECATFGTHLRMPTEMWPKTLEEFWEYWDHNCETLEITPWARELAQSLLYPKLPLYMFPASTTLKPFMRWTAIYWLPDRIRKDYGFEDTKLKRTANQIFKTQFKVVYRLTPGPIRRSGGVLGLMDMRSAAKRIQDKGIW